jgi:hypothetical protein
MPQLIARLLLTIFLVPLTVIVAIVTTIVCVEVRPFGNVRDATMAITVCLVTWGFFAIAWVAIWMRGVKWTPTRKTLSISWPVISALVAMGVGFAFGTWQREAGYFFGSVTAPLVWVFGTILIWRETDAERKSRQRAAHADVITCPTCGYNLTGLSEARCPECGAKFTLNDLYADQPDRVEAAADREISG